MHVGNRVFYRAENVAVIKRRQSVRQPTLNADFSRAQCARLDGFLRHGLQGVKVAVLFAWSAAESAELASDKTNIGKINIAVDHISNKVSHQIAPQHIGGY